MTENITNYQKITKLIEMYELSIRKHLYRLKILVI